MADEDIYADWSALRLAVPAAISLIVLGALGFIGIRTLGSGGDGPGSSGESELGAETISAVPLTPEGEAALVLDGFLDRLEQRRMLGLTFAFDPDTEAQQDLETITASLGQYGMTSTSDPVRLVDAANATALVTHDWVLEDGVAFSSQGEVDLVLVGTEWQVDWKPSVLVDGLDPGDVLVRERVVSPRAPILGRDGVALVDNREIVEIGVVPRLSNDIPGLTNTLAGLLGEDAEAMRAAISPSPSDSFVLIAVRRPRAIQEFRGELERLQGVVLRDSAFPLAPDDRFARALLGRSAEVTAEIIETSPDYFIVGDVAGRSGLQREYNERLSGLPGFQIAIRRQFPGAETGSSTATSTVTADDGTATDPGQGEGEGEAAASLDPDVVYLSPPTEPTPLQTTIDVRVQTAAENALARTDRVSALVAVEVSTGNILAVANGPGSSVNNFAMTGQYPPGSIFKSVTAYAALAGGLAPDAPIDCPEVLNVNGRDFRNAEGEVLGTVPFWFNFTLSCNTAFINIGNNLNPSDYPSTALALGVGGQYNLGTASYAGSVPTPSGPVESAATSFGQSRILMSPLSAAVMSASIAGGAYRPPTLIVDPDSPPAEAQPLDPTAVDNLRQMMRAVVTQGTGSAVANVAGGAVSGKTGTAEFGDEVPPRTHAWFVGYQGDLAFAVFVEDGGFGGSVAAPLAAAFLNEVGG